MWRICTFLLLVIGVSTAQASEPDFKDYPAHLYTGKNHPALITPEYRNVRTRIRNKAKQPVNFAGHYSLDWIGCGTGCAWALPVDVKTGKLLRIIEPLPVTDDCLKKSDPEQEPQVLLEGDVKFQSDSRLLIVTGRELYAKEMPDNCMTRYYLEENGLLKLLKKVPFAITP